MKYKSLSNKLPYRIFSPLFGNRRKYGLEIINNDPCWSQWSEKYHDFYTNTQKKGVGSIINNAGYNVLKKINLDGLNVLEIGPGGLFHINYWKGKPKHYTLVDLDEAFLNTASDKLKTHDISFEKKITTRNANGAIPVENNTFDLIISFYSFEHLYPFSSHLKEMLRVLKPDGKIVGAIPAEGGLAWGIGRYFTSRKWLLKNTTINPDKIICWEHPTTSIQILNEMNKEMSSCYINFWPFKIPFVDMNLIIQFIYQKL